jgi:hypothetical protein
MFHPPAASLFRARTPVPFSPPHDGNLRPYRPSDDFTWPGAPLPAGNGL